jgi:hypothetical protein
VDERLLRASQREVLRQCRFAMFAGSDLYHALQAKDHDRTWYSVQGIVAACANLSKLLWPNEEGASDRRSSRETAVTPVPGRGEALRDSLGVSSNSLLQSRSLRNCFEHFDEELEAWAGSSEKRTLIDTNLGPASAIRADAGEVLRNLDPATLVLTFRGESFELRPLLHEVVALHERTVARLEKEGG